MAVPMSGPAALRRTVLQEKGLWRPVRGRYKLLNW